MYAENTLPPDPYTQDYPDSAPPPPPPPPGDRDLPPRGRSRSRSPARENGYRSPYRRRSPPPRRPANAPVLQPPNPSNVLGVFGLSIRTQERDLDEEFSRFGRVEKVTIVYDQRSDRSRGFGFIKMATVEEATRCIQELNGVDLNGRRIRVDYSVTDRPHAPTPGEYMGHRRQRDSYRGRDERDYRDRDRDRDRDHYRRRDDRDRDYYGRDSRDWRERRSPPPRRAHSPSIDAAGATLAVPLVAAARRGFQGSTTILGLIPELIPGLSLDETSKRGTTNDRRKVHNKVRESKKKKAKQAKKNPNPQWKSKHKKDPGIPNNFPFKDQVLAEVAEQRRLAAGEKQRRKDAKKGLQQTNEEDEANDIGTAQDGDDDDEDFEGVATIGAKRLIKAKATTKPLQAEVEDEEDEDEGVPMLINRDLPHLQAVLDQSDIIIQVLDARDPLSFRSSHLEQVVASKPGKKMMFVLNKIDACPQESAVAWAAYLRREHPTFLFHSASSCLPGNPSIPAGIKAKGKGKAKEPSNDAVGLDFILECLGHWAKDKENTTVAVVGITNVGKSAFINSLLRKTALPVYTLSSSSRGPTTTVLPQEVTLDIEGKIIQVIDTPGLMWEVDKTAHDAEKIRARDILLRNKGRIDRLKDPSSCVAQLVSRSSAEDLMLLYSLPTFIKGDLDSFLSGMARAQQFVRKKGVLDLTAASKAVLRDWSMGKIHWYTTPNSVEKWKAPPPAENATQGKNASDGVFLESMYAKDSSIHSTLQPRKVMRKAVGLVRLTPGEVDSRKVELERLYEDGNEGSSEEEEDERMVPDEVDEEEDSEEGEDDRAEDDSEDGEEEGEDEEEEEQVEEELPSLSRKQKRKRTAEMVLPPSKKVAFASVSKPNPVKPSVKPSVKPIKSALKTNAKAPKGKQDPSGTNTSAKSQKAISGDEAYDFGNFF
ncbi:hypothetical protein D9758_007467 [Tetrapyrgos nigripes]|uniref:RRM domain-containing protein n=1 Tax=Tetrapyrgos nigripes TaxID=182062 RepID=A0A8H5G3P5_9AGAR|nr:hypothetical protein D9758_007467 [Tetrapyrgos nigripes]